MSAAALSINGDQQPIDTISTAVPQAVAFLIDARKLGHWKDIYSDMKKLEKRSSSLLRKVSISAPR